MRTTQSFRLSASRLYALAVCGFVFLWPALAPSQIDCITPAKLSVSQVRGQVFDPFGIPVSDATVSLVSRNGKSLETTSDETGRFALDAPLGLYFLKVEQQGFALSSTELYVGRNLWTTIHRQELRVMLGFAGSYCPWVTTSKREFLTAVQANIKRLKDTFQTNATQK